MSTLALLILCGLAVRALEATSVKHFRYSRCPLSNMTAAETAELKGTSELRCLIKCSQSQNCLSLVVCPSEKENRFLCDPRNYITVDQCSEHDLPNSCHLLTRITQSSPLRAANPEAATTERLPETTELVCQNGGTPNDNNCTCPSPYVGITCERIMRDCQEGLRAGHSRSVGVYSIQPSKSSPFKVKCENGYTRPFYRNNIAAGQFVWSSMTWEQAVLGFGDDLETASSTENFFIGLENLRKITSQAEYKNNIFFMYNNWSKQGSVVYSHFNLSTEADDYKITYNSFSDIEGNGAENGLLADSPLVFSAVDHDPYNCTAFNGAPGWYGSDCRGYSLFADRPVWPVRGVDNELNHLRIHLTPDSDYYED